MSESLQGKIAVITGAASGIGLATTEALLEQGATVVMVDWNEKALNELVAKLGERAIAQVTNLLDTDSCNAMIPEILAKVDHIDILYCNAGTYIGGDLTETTPEAIDKMLNLNVNAVMKNVHAVVPHMSERKTGDIIVTCSIAGHFPTYWEPVYSGSKWAITSFVQGMRRQMIPHGVRVAQVSPGPVVSALLADWPEENLRKAKESGSLIDASEVADAIVYMLTRKRTVTIRDMLVLPTNFDRV
ncbi:MULTISPECIES: SDR family oxidoreductase [Rhizobium/Agrobacterium group]|jgi:ribitol 2-dehydrogenase|uniref:SDR family NAD(P)-dependent oxidoreductase n=1 Tax=Rhizobium rhizogenes TaxID=359 RepID=A0AA92C504_RHIRH|nr:MULTISPECIES: SDR family oxidoreductase [Rhizobium/Agrobacterium group]KQM32782.1 glucose dehydrogenase [Rhizobium sp. Leaf202]KQN84666.1 glucose dehydrogenase [Rhizobium sp. Leaf68]KQR30077.1 glucose dehydrogenase [Rhizobium sp. Leaf155]KRA05817.1 glucose dehydrogenase [Rhizobium sp. Root564]PVE65552.1 SDR family NAD(P)-dependent oxidoreductase [Agrobacterium tumefaciens]PVE75616.1 SDR family NAD(P)-dependent oxidoreductase [Sphingomonas sp. TPD3009]